MSRSAAHARPARGRRAAGRAPRCASSLAPQREVRLDALAPRPRHRLGARSGSSSDAQDGLGQRVRVARRHQQPGLAVERSARACPRDRWPTTGVSHGQRLADRAGEAEPGVGGVDDEVAGGEDLGDVARGGRGRARGRRDRARAASLGDARDARRRRAHEEQPRAGRPRATRGHGVEHVVAAAPRADADLGDERRASAAEARARGGCAPPSTPGWKRSRSVPE